MTAQAAVQNAGVLVDGQGNPVRTSSGSCIAIPGEPVSDPRCLPDEAPRNRVDSTPPETVAQPRAPRYAIIPAETHFRSEIPFAINSAGLPEGMRAELRQFLVSLEEYFQVTGIEVVGHADASGRAAYNLWLSEKRAESAAIHLRSLGVDPRILSLRGAGETELREDLAPTAAAQRRVEIHVQVTQREKLPQNRP